MSNVVEFRVVKTVDQLAELERLIWKFIDFDARANRAIEAGFLEGTLLELMSIELQTLEAELEAFELKLDGRGLQ